MAPLKGRGSFLFEAKFRGLETTMAGGVLGLALTKTILGLVSLLVLVLQLLLDTGETPPEAGRTPPGYWRGSDNEAVEAIQHRTVAEIPLPG